VKRKTSAGNIDPSTLLIKLIATGARCKRIKAPPFIHGNPMIW
jgi:hypothetical protein